MKKDYYTATYFVSRMYTKHHASKLWVWEVLEAELNIYKGEGAILTPEEFESMEEVIVSGLNGEW